MAEKRLIMGMGHRVYKAKDPRAVLIERDIELLAREKGDESRFRLLKRLEKVAGEWMLKRGRSVYPNVDFFSGELYRLLGIPPLLFTPIFAIARAAGWLAHILEQRVDNRLFRPESLYSGPAPRPFVRLADRGKAAAGRSAR